MDAHAYLTRQGWRGKGHSLHHSSDSIGLARPLLVSQKQNTLGVGKKQHKTSDQWWMNAFDKSLKGLDATKEGTVVQTVNNGGLDMVAKGGSKFVGTGGLYSCFVRGETLVGSIGVKDEVVKADLEKRVEEDKKSEKTREKRRRKDDTESKEERRARKLEKRKKRAAKEKNGQMTPPTSVSTDDSDRSETKEERRERKRLKKAAKEAKRTSKEERRAAKAAKKGEKAAKKEKRSSK
jgi:nucleolar protein TMA23